MVAFLFLYVKHSFPFFAVKTALEFGVELTPCAVLLQVLFEVQSYAMRACGRTLQTSAVALRVKSTSVGHLMGCRSLCARHHQTLLGRQIRVDCEARLGHIQRRPSPQSEATHSSKGVLKVLFEAKSALRVLRYEVGV